MAKARTKIIFVGGLLILLAGGFFYYFYYYQPAVNYLIPGVPYNGIYNVFFKNVASAEVASVMDILDYWGDERFSKQELEERFSPSMATSSPSFQNSLSMTKKLSKDFENNGYETYQWISPEPGNEIKEIKKFVNPDKKIPVIIFQKRSFESLFAGPRVVIGIFDKEKKVIVHDYFFGNNYEIQYQDFEKMFAQNARAILAVWPSDKIKELINGPDYNMVYPPRLEAMDKLGPILTSKLADATFYRLTTKDYAQSNAAYEDLVNDQNFKYLPAAFQVTILSAFAGNYIYLKQYDEAIKIINEVVMPLNKNLGEAPSGWYVLPVDKFVHPYFVLSLAYLKKGQKNLALAAYKDYKELRQINESVREKLGETFDLPPPLIEELEKAISSKK